MIAKRIAAAVAGALVVSITAPLALAYDVPVEKKVFTMPSYTTEGGRTIRNVRVGYETYGKLNAAGDNAIFIAHFFSGNSHAAGKYGPADAAPGYWDPIIGSGKPIDTDKYFVISADALANLNTKDPNVTTTGPASIDPDLVERVVHVVGPGFDISPYVLEMLDVWVVPIEMDPKWNHGDYYG